VTTVLVCSFSISAISVDRWKFILNTGKDQTKKICVYFCIGLIWLVAVAMSLPMFVVNDVVVFKLRSSGESLLRVCEEKWTRSSDIKVYSAFISSFQYVLPVVVIILTHLRICHFLINMPTFEGNELMAPSTLRNQTVARKHMAIHVDNDNSNTDNSRRALVANHSSHASEQFTSVVLNKSQRFKRSRQILLLGCVSFILCWIPLSALNIYFDFFFAESTARPVESNSSMESVFNSTELPQEQQPETDLASLHSFLFLTCHVIAMSSSCINAIVYGFLNRNFYNEFKRIFYQTIRRQPRSISMIISERNQDPVAPEAGQAQQVA
jgi:hypothetical protein